MKQILIKIGKARSLVRNEGLFRGLQKSFSYGLVFLRSLWLWRAGDILLVTGGVGDSARYRARNVAEELRQHGFRCAVTVHDNPFLLRQTKRFKVFILHKVLNDAKTRQFIERLQAQKKEIIFDTDDLNFDPDYFDQIDYLKQVNALEKKAFADGVGAETLKNPYVTTATATTSFLAEKLKTYGKQVFVVANKLSAADLETAEKIVDEKQNKGTAEIRLGYFSGSIGHNKDFATITNTLASILEKHTTVKLYLVGPLETDSVLARFGERVVCLPFVSRTKHFTNIASVDINLVPLEIGNPFCEARSELKFFEAGIVGVPTVAAATQTFREAITDGVDGFIANSPEEWQDKLERLIMDAKLRQMLGAQAREKALRDYTTKNSHNESYYNYLRSKL